MPKEKKFEFVECPCCSSKPGCPTLCQSCYNNRLAISSLRKSEIDSEFDKMWKSYVPHLVSLTHEGQARIYLDKQVTSIGFTKYIIDTESMVVVLLVNDKIVFHGKYDLVEFFYNQEY